MAGTRKRAHARALHQRRKNPELGLLVAANPGGRRSSVSVSVKGARLMSRRVLELEYEHVEEEGKKIVRYHPFGPGVQMWALEGGQVLLTHARGKPLWEDFT